MAAAQKITTFLWFNTITPKIGGRSGAKQPLESNVRRARGNLTEGHRLPSTPRGQSAISRCIETKPPLKERFQTLLAEYGRVVFVIYFAIFGLVFAGFAIAIRAGVQVDSASGELGTIGAAYVATKLTQPVRILATLVLTPIVAKLVSKFGRKQPPPTPPSDPVL